jgi:hypothetical protein
VPAGPERDFRCIASITGCAWKCLEVPANRGFRVAAQVSAAHDCRCQARQTAYWARCRSASVGWYSVRRGLAVVVWRRDPATGRRGQCMWIFRTFAVSRALCSNACVHASPVSPGVGPTEQY